MNVFRSARSRLADGLAEWRHHLPIGLWLVAVVVCAWMLFARVQSHEFLGLAQADVHEVSPTVTGEIAAVFVRPFELVNKGDMVARLNDETLRAQVRTEQARADQLQAELEAERGRLQSHGGDRPEEFAAEVRRFQIDAEDRSLEALSIAVELEGDAVEAERLKLEAERAEGLFSAGLTSQMDLDTARLAHRQMEVRVEHNRNLLKRVEEQLSVAERRLAALENAHPGRAGLAVRPAAEAVRVQAAILEQLQLEVRNLGLLSPISGEVTQVLCQEGQAVIPGEPLAYIAGRAATEIVAFARESAIARVRPNAPVSVSRRGDPRRVVESQVVRVGSGITMTPAQLWADPRVAEYGLPFVIGITPSMSITPGEVVLVRLAR